MTAVLPVIPDMKKNMAPPTVSTVHKVFPCVHDEHCNDDLRNLNEDGWLSFIVAGELNDSVMRQDCLLRQVWYKSLGHISEAGLHVLEKKGLFGRESLGKLDFCENCILRKSHRVRFGVGRHTTQEVIDYVHSDLWGPSQVESLGSKRYFLSIIDDYSRRVWVYILRFKHEAFGKFKEWKQLVENQTGRTVKKPRTDNGLEFCNWKFEQLCIKSGIARHLTVAGTPLDCPRPSGQKRHEDLTRSVMDGDDEDAGGSKKTEEQDLGVSRSSSWAKVGEFQMLFQDNGKGLKVFKSLVRHTSVWVILALTAYKDYELEQLDVKTTFLHGNLEEMIYMRKPPGYEQDDMLIACMSKGGSGVSTKSLLKKEYRIKELGKDCDVERMSKVPYANAVGSLMYLMVSFFPRFVVQRPDIAYAVLKQRALKSEVGTEHNAADALTKMVPGRKLQHCLELLKVVESYTKIVDCKELGKLIIVPVFYHVDPSHVRHQSDCFIEGFAKHEADLEIALAR
ncbi:retrovirus-related pol polyprotein from transposon TNT 1-94 [Tanacetum coccineum]|uniref:Retrovirus-related pol polyprotein from transposon TNT 1-94 n=1 Tax=Tanacetum coccineum TaxID=301880 RepID=A0ABQ5C7R3_9ASTR